jgi:hypothetical protein
MLMNVTQSDIDALIEAWAKISKEAEAYFERVWQILIRESGGVEQLERYGIAVKPEFIAEADSSGTVASFAKEIPKFVMKLIEASKSSPLVSDVDRADLRVSMREILAALKFLRYQHWGTNILNDEDRVLGVEPPGQREDECGASEAFKEFTSAKENIQKILGLLVPSDTPEATAIARSETANIKKYRPNTAFIMMWISKEHPELEDVKNCFTEVFKKFGITAVRSDEIEHSEQITERILAEIATSEFLIADLTGERTSVYYEVGYAHALGKRPILYRKANTKLGFDLAGHNCPEYENLTDLRMKLEARLSAITNKTAAPEAAAATEAKKV